MDAGTHRKMWIHRQVQTERCGYIDRYKWKDVDTQIGTNGKMWIHRQVQTERCGYTDRYKQEDVDTQIGTNRKMWKRTQVGLDDRDFLVVGSGSGANWSSSQ